MCVETRPVADATEGPERVVSEVFLQVAIRPGAAVRGRSGGSLLLADPSTLLQY